MRFFLWPFEFLASFFIVLIPLIIVCAMLLVGYMRERDELKYSSQLSLARIEATAVANSDMNRLKLEEMQQFGMTERAKLYGNNSLTNWTVVIAIALICGTVLFIYFYTPKRGNYLPLPKGFTVLDNNQPLQRKWNNTYVIEDDGRKLLFDSETQKYLGEIDG